MNTTSRANDQGCFAPLLAVLVIFLTLTAAPAFAGVGVWMTNGPPNGGSSVIADRRNPGVLYADARSSSESGFVPPWKSTDYGATWRAVGDLRCQDLSVIPLATAPPSTVYFSVNGILVPGVSASSLVASTDGGATCTYLFGPVLDGSFTLAVDAVNTMELYVGSYSASTTPPPLSRSLDGGMTWTRIDSGLPPGAAYIVADPQTSGTLYLAMTQTLFKSVDAGTTWVSLTTTVGEIRVVAVAPSNPYVVYMVVTPTPLQSGPGSVLKSIDGGATFTQASTGLPTATVSALCVNPRNAANLYAATAQGGVFASLDGGTSWQAMNSGLTNPVVYSLSIDPTGEYLHAGTAGGVFDYQLASPTCSADTHTLCLNNGRFSVTADFQPTALSDVAIEATAVPLTNDTGYFWFFDPANIEIVTKVLNGCSVNGNFWFFASGLTNVGVQITVTDTVTGAVKPYSNALGTPFQPVQDTAAFPCP